MVTPSPSVAAARAEQRKQIWGGCQTVLGCSGVVAIIALWRFGLGLFFVSDRAGAETIVFVNERTLQDTIFWFVLFGAVALFVLLAGARSVAAALIICASIIALALLATAGMYSRVAAMSFSNRSVTLHYIRPRPPIRLANDEIISAKWDSSVHGGDDALLEYTVYLQTTRGNYSTFADTNLSDAQNAVARIEAMQSRR